MSVLEKPCIKAFWITCALFLGGDIFQLFLNSTDSDTLLLMFDNLVMFHLSPFIKTFDEERSRYKKNCGET